MSQTVKAANAHTVVATGWTTPTNAYSTANDLANATIATVKNATVSGDFGFPAFTTADIPDHATIQSVIVRTTWSMSVTVTGGVLGMQLRRNTGGVALGSETTAANPLVPTDAAQTGTGATLTDLRTANELRARLRATKGNSSTGSDGRLDRVYLEVNWVETITAAAGTITLTASFSEAGQKKTSVVLGTFTPTLSFAEVGIKKTSGAGSLTTSATLSEVGRKAASGAASAISLTVSLATAGLKTAASAAGAITQTASLALSAAKAAAAALSLVPVAVFSEAGTKDTSGAAILSASAGFSEVGSKALSAALGVLAASAVLVAVGSEGGGGALTMALAAALTSAGLKNGFGAGLLSDSMVFLMEGVSVGGGPAIGRRRRFIPYDEE